MLDGDQGRRPPRGVTNTGVDSLVTDDRRGQCRGHHGLRSVDWRAMAMVHLPDELVRRLEAEAVRRGVSVEELAVEALRIRYGSEAAPDMEVDALEAFIGAFDSGDPDWAGTDTRTLRAEAAHRRLR